MKSVICLLSGVEVAHLPGISADEVPSLSLSLIEAGFEVEVRNEANSKSEAA
jgi:hypothetical protein